MDFKIEPGVEKIPVPTTPWRIKMTTLNGPTEYPKGFFFSSGVTALSGSGSTVMR